ncbi:MAG: hypothetical protein AAGG01_03230 [Planctomycetota bacterium]
MEPPTSGAPDAIAHGTPAVPQNVDGHLKRVAFLVIEARETLQSDADGNPHTRRLIEELGCLVGEAIQMTRASAHGREHRSDEDDGAIGTFCPVAYVAESTAKLAGLLKRPARFKVTLHPDCAGARIRMHRADLMRVLTGLLRSADEQSDESEPIELDLDIVASSHPLATRGRMLPAGRYFSFRISGTSQPATTRAGQSHPGIHLGRASRLVTRGLGGLRYHHGPGVRTTREAVLPLYVPQRRRSGPMGFHRDLTTLELDQSFA